MTPGQAQLLVYGFGPGAEFEGRLVGAIERIESGGTLRVLDVLFVMRDADTDELVVTQRRGRGQGSLVAPLLGFRLDAGERRRASEKALRERFVATLDKQEDRLAKIAEEEEKLRADREAAREKLSDLLSKLEYEADVAE